MVIVVCKDVSESDCCCSIESETVVCTHGPFDTQEEAETWVVFATHRMTEEDTKCYWRHEVLELKPVNPEPW